MADKPDETPARADHLALALGVVAALFLGWGLFVVAAGSGVNPFNLDHHFTVTGAFGDSFGVFSALMTAAAAVFTYQAYRQTRDENSRLKQREIDRDRQDEERQTEATFYRLLEFRMTLIRDIRIADGDDLYLGTDALHEMYEFFVGRLGRRDPGQSLEVAYNNAYSVHKNDLGHYLRFTYHIIRYVIDNAQDDEKRYHYLRLLRAQLSNSEQALIALNCLYGEGRWKFKAWVNQFALLHNLDQTDRDRLGLDDDGGFDPSAFGLRPETD